MTLSGLPRETHRELSKLEPCAERLGQLAQAVQALLRLRCHNRARERRRIRHFLPHHPEPTLGSILWRYGTRRIRHFLADWAPLQDAEEGDLSSGGWCDWWLAPP